MKKILVTLSVVLLIVSCRKHDCPEPPVAHPQMRYTGLNNLALQFGQQQSIDLDGDNAKDLLFTSALVGDPILKRDLRQYYVTAAFHVSLLVNQHEQTPVLSNGDPIKQQDNAGGTWYNANSIVLAEQIIELTGPAHWEGNWKNASRQYIAIQIERNGARYNGWVEVSFDTDAGTLVLHRAAIALEVSKAVKAGY
jgi:hypothetical protein